MTDVTVSRDWLNRKDEDYTGSVCLLLPQNQATLIDAEMFEWAVAIDWQVMGRSVFYVERWPVSYRELPGVRGRTQRRRVPAKTTMHSLHRLLIFQGLDFTEQSNLSRMLRKRHVDHINRNPWDNRRVNLRVATPSQNCHNVGKQEGKSSQYKGVSKVGKSSWRVSVRLRGKLHRLGTYRDELSAAIAYNRFAEVHIGEFAYLNPITASPSDEPFQPERRRGRPARKLPKPRRKPPKPILGEDGQPLAGFALFKHLLGMEAQKRKEQASQSSS